MNEETKPLTDESGNPLPEGTLVVENEEQARELVDELKKSQVDPELAAHAKVQAQLDMLDRIYSKLPRRQKRKLMKPKLKFSNRVKAALKNNP